jgi:hypothetical protein
MAIRLPRTEAALADCRAHLDAVQASNPTIDTGAVSAYLAVYLGIVLCAEVEDAIRSYLTEVVNAQDCTGRAEAWAKPRSSDVRSARFRDLYDLIAWKWDRSVAKQFEQDALAAGIDDAAKNRLGNVVQARDDNSHRGGATITSPEVELAADVARSMLTVARSTMGLPAS